MHPEDVHRVPVDLAMADSREHPSGHRAALVVLVGEGRGRLWLNVASVGGDYA